MPIKLNANNIIAIVWTTNLETNVAIELSRLLAYSMFIYIHLNALSRNQIATKLTKENLQILYKQFSKQLNR